MLLSEFVRYYSFLYNNKVQLCLCVCILCFFFHTAYVSYYCNTVGWTWWDWSLIHRTSLPSVLWHCWSGLLTRKNLSLIWSVMCLVDHHHHQHQHQMVFLKWPKQQRHHEDHYSQSRPIVSRVSQCCKSNGISKSSDGAGRWAGMERRWHHLVSCSRS